VLPIDAAAQGQKVVTAIGATVRNSSPARPRITYFSALGLFFLLSLPLINPWVRGDGVGYYAYVRAVLIDHNLHFDKDWLAANSSFKDGRVDGAGRLLPEQYSATGYVANHFAIGPSFLWAPFLIPVHVMVLVADRFGAHIPATGYSRPYLLTMAAATALYGFAALLLAFDLARRYFGERWAFLATVGIWFASSLPVYMYFNPSWSHAHSAFAVALFLWYYQKTRQARTPKQWLALGLAAGLMIDMYYPNAIFLLVPAVEGLAQYFHHVTPADYDTERWPTLLGRHMLFIAATAVMLLPMFVTRLIIYGHARESGYPPILSWNWGSPVLLRVLFSADHGMLSWTPILVPAILGLAVLWRRDPLFGGGLLLALLAYYYFIASYPDWDGISSFGNRFFVSLTPIFVIGLAATLDWLANRLQSSRRYLIAACAATALLVVWNFGLIFQWGTQLIPARGPISWRTAAHNQYAVVPRRIAGSLEGYLLNRRAMMQHVESQDLDRLHSQQ
jgi:hypothetical protein